MTRSSRHKSHRGHKHGSREEKERSESEDEREARDLKADKRKASPAGGDVEAVSGEHGRKRKDRGLDVPEVGDRWNGEGSAGVEEKEARGEEFGAYEEERAGKSRALGTDQRSRSSRRHEASGSERREETSVREELKRRSEKDLPRRDGSGQNVDGKEGERDRRLSRDERERAVDKESGHGKERERGVDKDKEHVMERDRDRDRDHIHERSKEYERKRDKDRRADGERERHSTRERSSDGRRDKSAYSSTIVNYEDEYLVKVDSDTTERSKQLGIYDRGNEKDPKKDIKRDEFIEKDKWLGDGRKGDEKRTIPIDDRSKSGNHYDEKYKDGGFREKLYDEFDRERRSRNDKYRGERSSRDHTSDRSESKYYKDLERPLENRMKTKIQDTDREVTSVTKEYNSKHSDNRGRKRSPDYNIEYADTKPRHAKESRSSVDKSSLNKSLLNDDRGRRGADSNNDRGRVNALDNYKLESHDDRGRPESFHSNRVEHTPSRDRQKNSPVLTVHAAADESRSGLKHGEPLHRSLSKEGHHTSSASSDDHISVSGVAERTLEAQSVESSAKFKELSQTVDCVADDLRTPSQGERITRTDGNPPVVPHADRSPSSSDRQNSHRKGARRSLDVEEMVQRGSHSRDGREYSSKEERARDFSQGQLHSSESGRAGSMLHNRTDHISRGSPGHLPPPPPSRHGIDGLSVQRSADDDVRSQAGERKLNNHYKRGGDPNMGRGQGGAWNGVPSWAPPVANGFMPFQHGPSGAFIQVAPQFPPPFGVRPYVDFNPAGVPLHMHEPPPDRFSGHGRPFGWRNPNPADNPCPPHLQGWDGNSGMYGNDPHMYARSEWEHGRHLVGERAWEMNGSLWKGQHNGTTLDREAEFPTRPSVDEPRTGQTSISVDQRKIIETNETEQTVDSARSVIPECTVTNVEPLPEPQKSEEGDSDFFSSYFSKFDISLDLARPSLYKQYMNIVQNEEHEVASRDHGLDQNFSPGFKLTKRRVFFTGKPVLSAVKDSVFKNAMSLYKKICEPSVKWIPGIVAPEKDLGCDSENSNPANNALPGALDTNNEQKIVSPEPMEEDVQEVGNGILEVTEAIETEAPDDAVIALGASLTETVNATEVYLSPSSGGSMQFDSIKISSPGGVEVISAGDRGCESIMPECLSRIPISPKSTH